MMDEVGKSPSNPDIYLVNPGYTEIDGRVCLASLDDIPGPVDLVLMGVPDSALEAEMRRAAARGDRSAVIFGGAFGASPEGRTLRTQIASIATGAGMALCGGGCMGFVNVASGIRAIGYVEPDPVPAGPLALVSCSGSAFSAMLRTHRQFGWTLAVSSGQELVTPAAAYLDYAISLSETKVVALLLEAMRDPKAFREALERASANDVAVIALTVGRSEAGRAMVSAHSGALAGEDASWEALFDAYGVMRVRDLDEMTDTMELFCTGRRPGPRSDGGGGVATVHDSGGERALAVDLASDLSLRFSSISSRTEKRLSELLDPGLVAENPLDMWGTGADTAEKFGQALIALGDDPETDVVALSIDLVFEYDGDDSYEKALLEAARSTTKPVALLSNLHSAIDPAAARRLRSAGIPVLEGTRTGMLAIGHMIDRRDASARPRTQVHEIDGGRQKRWLRRLASGPLSGVESLELVAEYGIPVTSAQAASDREQVLRSAEMIGLPVVLKTEAPDTAHKSDVGGVVVNLSSMDAVGRAYDDMSVRLGPDVLVAEYVADGVELALGIVSDPGLGPIVVVGAGGVLVELMADRAVCLPPLDSSAAHRMLERLEARPLLDGVRGARASDVDAVTRAIVSVSVIATELAGGLQALDINPLRCGPGRAVALDALVVAV
jgi:acyl-CoA synthetase (NDP forming)